MRAGNLSCIRLLLYALVVSLFTHSSQVLANSEEEQYVAAFSYKVLQFVDFPLEYDKPSICFAGADTVEIANVIKDQLQQKNQDNSLKIISKASIRQLSPRQCHVLYVAPLTVIDKPFIQNLAKDSLIIGNSDDFKSFGNTAAIVFEDNRPQITISRKQLKFSTFEVQARLLNAITVVP